MNILSKKSAALFLTLLMVSSAIVATLVVSVPVGAHAQDTTGGLAQAQAANAATGGLSTQGPDSNCSVFAPSKWFTNCVWIPLMSWLGSWFLTIGGGLLRLAGTVFDVLVYNVIVNFKGALDYLQITDAVNRGWTVFRDFANILIIGLFVFVAISIILGLKEFGQKKLIANVLIVAVLINFSLLFTKIIIDTSNFTALQIYNQMVGSAAANQGINGTPDLSGAFLRPMGITSVWNDTNLVTQQIGQQSQSGLLAFLYGLVGGFLLLAAAAVLFYGCVLIAARAILFIFLMLTAALAFATYLVPSLAHGEYGWSAWWKSLINNAVFAPLLMLFLAVSLGIINSAGAQKIAGTTLGAIIIDPAKQLGNNGWTAILIYIIGIGLLFVSFKMASKFAGTISGFSLAAVLPALGLAAGARVAAFAGRTVVGRPALRAGNALQEASKDTNRSLFMRQLYDFGAQRLKGVAKQDFNAMRTPLGAGVAGVTGLKVDQLAGKKIEGAFGAAEKRAERIAEQARRMTRTSAAQDNAEGEAIAAAIKASPALSARHNDAETVVSTHGSAKNAAEKEYKAAQEMRMRAELDIKRARQDNNMAAEVEANKALRESEQNMREQENRIKEAAQALNEAKSVLQNINDEARASSLAAGKLPVRQDERAAARELARKKLTSYLFTPGENKHIADLATHEVGKQLGKKKLKDLGYLDAFKDITKESEEGHAPPAPARPPAATARPPAAEHDGDGHDSEH